MTAWLLIWLWQGLALALGVSTAFRVLPRINAATRYLIWWGAFAALIWLGWTSSPHAESPVLVPVAPVPSLSAGFAFYVPPMPPWAVAVVMGVWLMVALFKLLRILPAIQDLYRLKAGCRPLPGAIEARLRLWQNARKHGRPVQLELSDDLQSPALLGLHQPSIAVPAALLDVVSREELDQIVLHEYGHVQRRDDWARLAQALLESALWIHPAAIWICRELNLEREVACDDWVVSKTGAPRPYAVCLSRVAFHTCGRAAPVFAPGMSGRSRDLVRRVDRLLDAKHTAKRTCSPAGVLVGLCVVTATACYLRVVPLVSELVTTAAGPTVVVRALNRDVPMTPGDAKTDTIGPDMNYELGQKTSVRSEGPKPTERRVRLKPDTTIAREATSITVDPGRSAGVDGLASINEEISLVEGRSMAGIYRAADAFVQPPMAGLKPITTIGDGMARLKPITTIVGASIGKATKTASLAVGNALSQASTSLAGSF